MDERIKLIELINRELIDHGQDQLSVRDFDILFELDVTGLMDVRDQIKAQLETVVHED